MTAAPVRSASRSAFPQAEAGQPTGLAAVPESWIPSGTWDATVDSALGTNAATVARDRQSLSIRLHGVVSFDVDLQDRGDGLVDLNVDKPWPMPDLHERGPILRVADDHLHMDDQLSGRSVDFYHMADGRVHIVMHKPGDSDDEVFLRRQ
jgi:hypothetical protein